MSRVPALDALRGLAVLLVLGRHLPSPDALGWLGRTWARGGWVGVDLFFVLSGFLVAGLVFEEHRRTGEIAVGRFLARRALRIYPAFYALLAATVAAGLIVEPARIRADAALCEALFVQNYGPHLWNPTWSLAVEEHFYLLLALGVAAQMARRPRARDPFMAMPAVITVVVVASLALRIATLGAPPYSPKQVAVTHLRLDALSIGVLCAYLKHYQAARWRRLCRRELLPLGALLLVPPFAWPLETTTGMVTWGLSSSALGAVLLLCGSHAAARSGHGARTLAWLGRRSYSIYLWHMPVVYFALPALGIATDHAAGALFCLASSVALGSVLERVVEAPFLYLRERWVPRSVTAPRPDGAARAV